MKITKSQLKQMIEEELEKSLMTERRGGLSAQDEVPENIPRVPDGSRAIDFEKSKGKSYSKSAYNPYRGQHELSPEEAQIVQLWQELNKLRNDIRILRKKLGV